VRLRGAWALLLGAWTAAVPLAAQDTAGDSARAVRDSIMLHRHILPRKDAWLLAGFTAGILAARPLDRTLTERLQRPSLQENGFLQNGAKVFRAGALPGGAVVAGGFYAAGWVRRDRVMSGVALHTLESLFVSQGIVAVVKNTAGRARPYVDPDNPHDYELFRGFRDGEDYRSFPSGHTAAAFAIASSLTAEATDHAPRIHRLVAIGTYTAASLTGLSRMYDEKHWASDVVAGAAVGTLTGMTLVRFNHAHPHNFADRTLLPRSRGDRHATAMVLPTQRGLAAVVTLPTGRGGP
jgi:membrane-associated phospholipid phosphatase